MRNQERRPGQSGYWIHERAGDQIDAGDNQRTQHAVGAPRCREVLLFRHVAVALVPAFAEMEVVEPVGAEISTLQEQAESGYVRSQRGLTERQLALLPVGASGIAQLTDVAGAMDPARFIAMELRRRHRPQVDPEGNHEDENGERSVPAREHPATATESPSPAD